MYKGHARLKYTIFTVKGTYIIIFKKNMFDHFFTLPRSVVQFKQNTAILFYLNWLHKCLLFYQKPFKQKTVGIS